MKRWEIIAQRLVVSHIPLSKGGGDDPSNIQWQATEEEKAKDKVERK